MNDWWTSSSSNGYNNSSSESNASRGPHAKQQLKESKRPSFRDMFSSLSFRALEPALSSPPPAEPPQEEEEEDDELPKIDGDGERTLLDVEVLLSELSTDRQRQDLLYDMVKDFVKDLSDLRGRLRASREEVKRLKREREECIKDVSRTMDIIERTVKKNLDGSSECPVEKSNSNNNNGCESSSACPKAPNNDKDAPIPTSEEVTEMVVNRLTAEIQALKLEKESASKRLLEMHDKLDDAVSQKDAAQFKIDALERQCKMDTTRKNGMKSRSSSFTSPSSSSFSSPSSSPSSSSSSRPTMKAMTTTATTTTMATGSGTRSNHPENNNGVVGPHRRVIVPAPLNDRQREILKSTQRIEANHRERNGNNNNNNNNHHHHHANHHNHFQNNHHQHLQHHNNGTSAQPPPSPSRATSGQQQPQQPVTRRHSSTTPPQSNASAAANAYAAAVSSGLNRYPRRATHNNNNIAIAQTTPQPPPTTRATPPPNKLPLTAATTTTSTNHQHKEGVVVLPSSAGVAASEYERQKAMMRATSLLV